MLAIISTATFESLAQAAMTPLGPEEVLPEPTRPSGPSPFREIDGLHLRAVRPVHPDAKRALILHGGGDAPGMNATLHGFALSLRTAGWEPWGVLHGWSGLTDPQGLFFPLLPGTTERFSRDAGTIIGTGHRNQSPFDTIHGVEDPLKAALSHLSLFEGGLFVVGGNGSGYVTERLLEHGVKALFCPGTIDGDIPDMSSIGLASATWEGAQAIRKLASTGASCVNVMVAEIMGARRGTLPLEVALAGGADDVIIPEVTVDLDDHLKPRVQEAIRRGRAFTIVVGEGADYVHRGQHFLSGEMASRPPSQRNIGQVLSDTLLRSFHLPAKLTAPRYLLRGTPPLPDDIIRGLRAGVQAAELLVSGISGKIIPPDRVPQKAVELGGFFTQRPSDQLFTEFLQAQWRLFYG